MRSLSLSLALLAVFACNPGGVSIDDSGSDVDDTSGGDDSGSVDSADDSDDPADTDGGTDTGDTADTDIPGAPPTVADLAQAGPWQVSVNNNASQAIDENCKGIIPGLPDKSIDASIFTPNGTPASDVVVVMTHGFARARSNMVGWGRHLASHGFETAIVDLCTNFIGIDHLENGRAMAQFAEKRYPNRDVILVGYSAGGLAAVLAGTQADNAIAVFGLDMVDSNGAAFPGAPTTNPYFGKDKVDELTIPFWGIRGEPSSCNENGNSVAVYDAADDGFSVKLVDAGHCDFERPKNAGAIACTIGCPDPSPSAFTDVQQQDVLAAMLVSYVQKMAGVGNQPEAFWTSGDEPYDTLTATNGPLKE